MKGKSFNLMMIKLLILIWMSPVVSADDRRAHLYSNGKDISGNLMFHPHGISEEFNLSQRRLIRNMPNLSNREVSHNLKTSRNKVFFYCNPVMGTLAGAGGTVIGILKSFADHAGATTRAPRNHNGREVRGTGTMINISSGALWGGSICLHQLNLHRLYYLESVYRGLTDQETEEKSLAELEFGSLVTNMDVRVNQQPRSEINNLELETEQQAPRSRQRGARSR